MKTHVSLSHDLRKRVINTALLITAILLLILFSGCPPADEEDTWRIEQDGILSSWILESAEFREMVDLDGPGNMLPTTDAKSVLFDIFNVYGNCSSIEEIAFRFTDDPPFQEDIGIIYGDVVFYAEVECPEGMGISSWVFDYSFNDRFNDDNESDLLIIKKAINDPLGLFDWDGVISLLISHSEIINGKYTISGHSKPGYNLTSSLPEPKPDLTFDFVFERVDPHLD
ncbi:MAG TPA: hypothetical protein DDY13_05515 [Cytophagales bacterium]|jgi:hypothetical protein|nr:hypothetical protein [Cytophagales bacterium]